MHEHVYNGNKDNMSFHNKESTVLIFIDKYGKKQNKIKHMYIQIIEGML